MGHCTRGALLNGTLVLLVAVMIHVRAGAARADFDIETKLTASDAAAGDNFGIAVGVSGTTAIVGAHIDSDAGSGSGSAYLFSTDTGNQLFKLTASDAAAFDSFGASVGISGATSIIGAFGKSSNTGAAYVFDVATGNQTFKLTASDATFGDRFGYSVAISGNTAIVGAYGNSDAGSYSGSAYLFDVTTGNQLFKLTATDAAASDSFGNSVAISGNTAIVGAYGNSDAGAGSGSAYLFDVTTGNQLYKLTASDAAGADSFGNAVCISGNTAIVGAYQDDDAGNASGSAYLFDVITGNQIFKLTASDAAANDLFGYSVAISGNTAIVASLGDSDAGSYSGSAYLFDVTTDSQLYKLTASDAAAIDYFGRSVAISSTTAIVGASGNDDAGGSSGSAYLFSSAEAEAVPLPSAAVLGLTALVSLVGVRVLGRSTRRDARWPPPASIR